MMHGRIHFVLVESLLAHWFFPDGAIRASSGILFYEVKNKRAFAEMHIFIVHFWGSPAPRVPAAEGATDQPRIAARRVADKSVMAAHREMIVHQEIRSGKIAHLLEAFIFQFALNADAHVL